MERGLFFTFNESMKREDTLLTASMEDYLEMICRLSAGTGFTRIHELSDALNVQPSSATRMVQRLSSLHLLKYEKYGVLILSDEGKRLGAELLRRHLIIEELLGILGVENSAVLQETEKIEHTLSRETARHFEDFVAFIHENPDIYSRYINFIRGR